MKKLQVLSVGIALFALAGCARDRDARDQSAQAWLRDAAGNPVAYAAVRDRRGLAVRVDARGLRPGTYGVHLHAVGRCDGPDFASAGPHWNPTTRQHGLLNPQGAHLGDLPNLVVDSSGRGRIMFDVPHGSVRAGDHGLLDDDGAAVVVHANRDDERSDPSGNSGARIACGVLE